MSLWKKVAAICPAGPAPGVHMISHYVRRRTNQPSIGPVPREGFCWASFRSFFIEMIISRTANIRRITIGVLTADDDYDDDYDDDLEYVCQKTPHNQIFC